jgi:hypothetical protein
MMYFLRLAMDYNALRNAYWQDTTAGSTSLILWVWIPACSLPGFTGRTASIAGKEVNTTMIVIQATDICANFQVFVSSDTRLGWTRTQRGVSV